MNRKSNKLPDLQPEVKRTFDSIHVIIHTRTGGKVDISRTGDYRLLASGEQKVKWKAKQKARISWPGGNGYQTIEDAQLMSRAMRWAADIAKNLNVRNPSILSDKSILEVTSF